MFKKLRASVLARAAVWWPTVWASLARRAVAEVRTTQTPLVPVGCRQLLVDVSIIAGHDAGTGIQRVVRSLLLELMRAAPVGYEVRPVRASRKTSYRYANSYLRSLGVAGLSAEDDPVRISAGDIFLGLDLSSRIVSSRLRDFAGWRAQGVRTAFVVYDLLPALHPYWFTRRARTSFRRWLGALAVNADALFCISRAVADDASVWMARHCGITQSELPADWFHLGADFPFTSAQVQSLVPQLAERSSQSLRQSALMVGTVEPRKGHAQVLDAFERLWERGGDAMLVIVGREGWHVQELAKRLRFLQEAGLPLVWLKEVSDTQLAALYASLGGLVMASEAEGFGLPLVEAAQYGMPMLARDLPVFREVAGDHASYFTGHTGMEIAPQLADWLESLRQGRARRSDSLRRLSWAESADQLKALLAKLGD